MPKLAASGCSFAERRPKKTIGAMKSPNSPPWLEYRYIQQPSHQLLRKPKWIAIF